MLKLSIHEIRKKTALKRPLACKSYCTKTAIAYTCYGHETCTYTWLRSACRTKKNCETESPSPESRRMLQRASTSRNEKGGLRAQIWNTIRSIITFAFSEGLYSAFCLASRQSPPWTKVKGWKLA